MSDLGELQQAPARTHRPSGASRLTASDSLRLALAAAWQARPAGGRGGRGAASAAAPADHKQNP